MTTFKTGFIFSLILFLALSAFAQSEKRPNVSMMDYSQVFDRSGQSLDLVLKGTSEADWHCETVDQNGVGHDCTLKTSSNDSKDSRNQRRIKVLSYIGPIDVNSPLYLTGTEAQLKDWHCDWVDENGIGHDCDWVDVIVIDED